MIMLTDDEQKLLHQCYSHLGYVVASPKAGVSHLTQSQAGGCGGDFEYQVTRGSLSGKWSRGEAVSITMPRLRQWAESLPDELCARARTAWATYPVDTRNLADLAAITHEAINLSAPMEQLELFSDPQSMAVAS